MPSWIWHYNSVLKVPWRPIFWALFSWPVIRQKYLLSDWSAIFESLAVIGRKRLFSDWSNHPLFTEPGCDWSGILILLHSVPHFFFLHKVLYEFWILLT